MRLAVDLQHSRQLRWVAVALLTCIVTATAIVSLVAGTSAAGNASASRSEAPRSITALGRVQPKDGVIRIAAPSFEAGPAIVTALHVEPGAWVEQGAVLATLRGREELAAALQARESRRAVARAKVAALTAGAKTEEKAAVQAEVASDEATLAYIETETRRIDQLHRDGMLSIAALESQQSRQASATQALQAKRARLKSLSTTRPADIAVAEAEWRVAESDVQEIQARLDATVLRAPFAGRVLAIHAWPGQSVGEAGVLSFGRTSEMFVEAEVLEEDLARIRVGHRATITGDAFPGAATGTVEEIGYLVGNREVFRNDPTAFIDARVVQVKIRVDRPEQLERFINARVTAVIDP